MYDKLTQARSQDLEKEMGLFWKSETTVSDLNPNFHCFRIRFKQFIKNWDGFFGRNLKLKRFFRAKTGDLEKKTKLRRIFRPKSAVETVFPLKDRWSPKKKRFFCPNHGNSFSTPSPNPFGGGAVFIFWAKIGVKSTRNVQFCILFRPMGGSSPPPPPLATLLD